MSRISPPKCWKCGGRSIASGHPVHPTRTPVSRYKINGRVVWLHRRCKREMERQGVLPEVRRG